jgi:hypothetical protein
MKITPERLRQIIEEEVKAKLLEQDDDYKAQSRRDFLRNLGKVGAGAAGFGASGGLLGKLVGKEKSARAQRIRDIEAANIEAGNTKAEKIKEFEDYLNNTAAFRWGRGEESMMQYPGSVREVDGVKRGIDVLPPSYAIALVALNDKKIGTSRFGIPQRQVNFSRSAASPQQIQYNLQTFFDDFQSDDFLPSSVLSGVEGIRSLPSSGLQRGTVIVNPEALLATPDYVLPENGLTVRDYYNWLYYNQFLSFDELEQTEPESQEREKMVDLFSSAQPGLWNRISDISVDK